MGFPAALPRAVPCFHLLHCEFTYQLGKRRYFYQGLIRWGPTNISQPYLLFNLQQLISYFEYNALRRVIA